MNRGNRMQARIRQKDRNAVRSLNCEQDTALASEKCIALRRIR